MSRSIALLLVLIFLTASYIMVSSPALSSTDVTEDSWVSKAPMHQARGGLGVAAVNGKIYAIGGSNASGLYPPEHNGEFLGINEEYNPATDTWTFKKPMPTPRAYFGITVYQNKIYCIGGTIGIQKVDIVFSTYILSGANEVYDPATDTWEIKASMPTARMQVQANVANGKIYAMGGFDCIEAPNEVYDPVTDSWTTKTPMLTAASHYASAVVDNKIYVVANNIYVSGEESKRLLIYNAENDTWAQGTPPPSIVIHGPVDATTSVMVPKRIYLLGVGVNAPNTPPPLNQVYDPKRDTWTTGTTILTNRLDFNVAVVDDKLNAIGGYTLSSPYSGYVTASAVNEQYTPIGYGAVPPKIHIVSPENKTYTVNNVYLNSNVNKPTAWIGYSLDGLDNVTITGNITLTGLSSGLHNLTVYAKDEFENGASETVYFTVAQQSELLPVTWVAAGIVIIAAAGAAPLVYFAKIKPAKKSQTKTPKTTQ